ncbi:MAG: methyltransferase domain-containing protein [Chloroflexi bacterium]|nr:methyltransferase domain-containing protein [Chloroflexota bacterium]MCI0579386.1 methyltransferase domain-containing protein [Chloroflexota bacterium]MCI0643788.1 methyltransferase domain-containing protein [Chloroflexota bacterium]MCI0730024.1 methyltransferase domain-containing protein [Chloroflexota bacterium]
MHHQKSTNHLTKLVQKMHAPPAAHAHSHEKLQTEGATINWPSLYDFLVKSLLAGREQKLRQAIVDLAHIQPGEKVLDVGCGTGTLAITARLKSGPTVEIVGRDASPEMIARARQKAAKAGLEIDFQPGLVEAMEFPGDTFDVVLSSFMVHHLPGDLKSKAFAEIYRVLKSGGRLLVVDFEPPQQGLNKMIFLLLLSEMMAIDNSKLPPLLSEAGFTSLKMGTVGNSWATFVLGRKR